MTLRQLTPADAALWQSIRLEALLLEPQQFSSRHADWVDRPLADFAARLATAAVWAIVESDQALAVACLTPDKDGAKLGWIESVYVRPEARGRGLARDVLAAVEAAARAQGLVELRLEVRAANSAARGLYAKLGFLELAQAGPSCGGCEICMAKML